MTTPTATGKRTGTTKASRATAKAKRAAGSAGGPAPASQRSRGGGASPKTVKKATTTKGAKSSKSDGRHTFTVTVPSFNRVTDDAVKAAMVPVAVAREVLPAKGGLPLYLGLGAMGVVGVLEWPVAVGIGVGYAVLRGKKGPLSPSASAHSN
ncbi:hypothetical protein ACFRMN_06560 [Streptomyces sp. NPDC056835]|uniref:hypothetical protein n=1 Tax=Streptomyces sp. NPDC056835 TaxID=3345956 RepID=UPI003680803A